MSTISLDEVRQLAVAMINAEREVERIEDDLKAAKKRVRLLSEESIPSAMEELQLKNFELLSGEKVSVKPDVYASISDANKPKAFLWLEENGFEGLIKTELSVQFGRDSAEEVEKLMLAIQKLNEEEGLLLAPDLSRAVNAQTLKAFLREQLAKGEKGLPLDLFGARPVTVTTIKKPAAKKAK